MLMPTLAPERVSVEGWYSRALRTQPARAVRYHVDTEPDGVGRLSY